MSSGDLRIQKIGGKVSYVIRDPLSCEKLAHIVGKCIAIEVEKVIFFSPGW